MDLTPYTGTGAKLPNKLLAAVLRENSAISMTIYPEGSVDHRFFHDAVVLTADTVDELYGDFTPTTQPYTPGTRPFLEKIVGEITAGRSGERERAIALLDWCRDIPDHHPNPKSDPFHGGTEEEVIRKGSSMCNEQARVLGILAQVGGIASRYVGHMVPILDYDDPRQGTGHGVNELYVDGAWAYFDIRGKFYEKKDGSLASTWDLIRDPSLIDRQPAEVLAHLRKGYDQSHTREYFSATTVHVIVNYLASDHGAYDYTWVWASGEHWQKGRSAGRAIRESQHRDIFSPLVTV